MATDFAGATAAIEQRLVDNWTTTPIGFINEDPPVIVNANGDPIPWALIEVTGTTSELIGIGTPGDQVWRDYGLIHVHVFTPVRSKRAVARQHATDIGEIFRNKKFYDTTPPAYVRTWTPRIDGGGDGSEDGVWYRVTMTCDWEFYHRA